MSTPHDQPEIAGREEGEAPHGITLERFAAISAAIAEGDRRLDQVLASHGMTEAAWTEVQAHHTRALAEDALLRDEPRLSAHYADLFARAQDALKPVAKMTPEEWAALVLDVRAQGGAALAARGLSRSDYLRLSRYWAKTMSGDAALTKRYALAASVGAAAAEGRSGLG